jgi:hypothetical protein
MMLASGAALGLGSLGAVAPSAGAAVATTTTYRCGPTKYSILFFPQANSPGAVVVGAATKGPVVAVYPAGDTAYRAADRLGLLTPQGAPAFSTSCAKASTAKAGTVPNAATSTNDDAIVCSFDKKPQLAYARATGRSSAHLYLISSSRTTELDAQLGGGGSVLRYDGKTCTTSTVPGASTSSSTAMRMPPVPATIVSAKALSKVLGYGVASVEGEPDRATDTPGGVVRSSTWGTAGGNGEITIDLNGPDGSGAPWDPHAAYDELVQNFDPSTTTQLPSIGDAATFRAGAGDDRLVVLHGDDVIVVKNLNGTTAGDTEAADTSIARLVLAKL